MKKLFGIVTVLLLTLTSCNYFGGQRIQGDGNVTEQTRANLSGFSALDISGAISVFVTQDSTYSVKVATDNNLQQFVETYVQGSRLIIRQANRTNLQPTQDIKVYVSAPRFDRFGVSGASHIDGQNKLTTDRLFVEMSGASHVKVDVTANRIDTEMSGACQTILTGQTSELVAHASGACKVAAFDLVADNVRIDFSGAGEAQVNAKTKLEVEASGATSVRYKGTASVSSRVSGAGSVSKVD